MTSAVALVKPALAEDGRSSAERTRAKLLEAGVSCFSELGYHVASTRLIETAAGVKRNLIIHHWGSKERFWQECVTSLMTAFNEELAIEDIHSCHEDSLVQLTQVIRNFISASAKFPQVQRIMLDEGKRDEPRLQWLLENYVRPLKEALEKILNNTKEDGFLADLAPETFFYTLVGSSSIFAMAAECRALFHINPFEPTAVARHAEALVGLITARAFDDRVEAIASNEPQDAARRPFPLS